MQKDKRFTIIEFVVAILVILLITLICYPKFLDILRKSSEQATIANLTALRSSIAIYYADNNGCFPGDDIEKSLLADDGKYIKYIPKAYCPPYTNPTNEITTKPTGKSGKWVYQVIDSTVTGRQAGELWIDCDKKDSKGVIWNTY